MIDCSKCPERGCCCGVFSMDLKFIEKHREKFQVKPTKEIKSDNLVAVLCSDFLCVFLNRKSRLCAIYDDRPEVCKLYGKSKKFKELLCPYFKPNGKPWSEAKIKQIEKYLDLCTKRVLDNWHEK